MRATMSSGMWLMLQQDAPDDYVLATGETHTVRDFVEGAFAAGRRRVDWRGEGGDEQGVDAATGKRAGRVDPRYFRPTEVDLLLGDASKARAKLGWRHGVELRRTGRRDGARGLRTIAMRVEHGGRRRCQD